jgi:hypothetical protein
MMITQHAQEPSTATLHFTVVRVDARQFSISGSPLVEPITGVTMPQVLRDLREVLMRMYPGDVPAYDVLYPVSERQSNRLI